MILSVTTIGRCGAACLLQLKSCVVLMRKLALFVGNLCMICMLWKFLVFNPPVNFLYFLSNWVNLSNLGFFLQKKPLNFYFKTRNHFRDEITRLVINTRLITTLKNVGMFKIIEFYWFMHSAFCSWKRFEIFITHSLEDVLLVVRDFQNGGKSRMLRNVSIYFLLFYHNNVMLKTDIMLDYW